jgi:hypothetical protein
VSGNKGREKKKEERAKSKIKSQVKKIENVRGEEKSIAMERKEERRKKEKKGRGTSGPERKRS